MGHLPAATTLHEEHRPGGPGGRERGAGRRLQRQHPRGFDDGQGPFGKGPEGGRRRPCLYLSKHQEPHQAQGRDGQGRRFERREISSEGRGRVLSGLCGDKVLGKIRFEDRGNNGLQHIAGLCARESTHQAPGAGDLRGHQGPHRQEAKIPAGPDVGRKNLPPFRWNERNRCNGQETKGPDHPHDDLLPRRRNRQPKIIDSDPGRHRADYCPAPHRGRRSNKDNDVGEKRVFCFPLHCSGTFQRQQWFSYLSVERMF
mmetsp:Transcript_5316/g.11161  ORF Transcript_5316/g.11161 Transcript_5316/m.11161 type:complete len:257 (-) Transcript_5316:380-1150(-)